MLDKELSDTLHIDDFTKTIIDELDWAEEQLNDPSISAIKYVDVKSRYETLRFVRDLYCDCNKNKRKKSSINS